MPENQAVFNINNNTLIITQGDITTAATEAIVNSANPQLKVGGGVDGAIHRKAGPKLLEAGQQHIGKYGNVFPGHVAVTPGFDLQASHIIHAVGPIWTGGDYNEEKILRDVYERCIEAANDEALKTIAFPAISCGVYGFPLEKAQPIALDVAKSALEKNFLSEIWFYLFSEDDFTSWVDAAKKSLP